jgi:hypothetical protein
MLLFLSGKEPNIGQDQSLGQISTDSWVKTCMPIFHGPQAAQVSKVAVRMTTVARD